MMPQDAEPRPTSNRERTKLGNLVSRGGLSIVSGQVGRVAIQFAGIFVMSRLMEPSDYGLVAMVGVFMAVGDLIRDMGLSLAGTREPNLTPQQASNLFWMNAMLGLVAGVALFLGAPGIAALYNEDRLIGISRALSLVFVFNGLQTQFQVHLSRAMRFSATAATDIVAQAVGLLTAVATAIAGLGYWALVVQQTSVAIVLFGSRACLAHWRPAKPRRDTGSIGHLQLGASLGAAQAVGVVASNADSFSIGRWWGDSDLGIYNRSYQLIISPIMQLLAALTHLVISTNAKLEQTSQARSKLLLQAQMAVSTPLAWVLAVVAANADVIIRVSLGSQWIDCAPILVTLCAAAMMHVLSYVGYWAFLILGAGKQLLIFNCITKTLFIAFIVAAAQIDFLLVAPAYGIAIGLNWIVCLAWLGRGGKVRTRILFFSGGKAVVCALGVYRLLALGFAHQSLWLTVLIVILSLPIYVLSLCLMSREARSFTKQVGRIIRGALPGSLAPRKHL